jgi:hypothetical protein
MCAGWGIWHRYFMNRRSLNRACVMTREIKHSADLRPIYVLSKTIVPWHWKCSHISRSSGNDTSTECRSVLSSCQTVYITEALDHKKWDAHPRHSLTKSALSSDVHGLLRGFLVEVCGRLHGHMVELEYAAAPIGIFVSGY